MPILGNHTKDLADPENAYTRDKQDSDLHYFRGQHFLRQDLSMWKMLIKSIFG